MLKLASQNNEVVRALADESAWIGITNLGTDDRVKDAGGPVVKRRTRRRRRSASSTPRASSRRRSTRTLEKFINALEQAPWIAKNFLTNGRPLFNEKAYKLLVNQGHGARAAPALQQAGARPEDDDQGPAGNQQAYIDAFNEVFGA